MEDAQESNASTGWITLLGDAARTGGLGLRPTRAPSQVRWQLRLGRSIRGAPILDAGILYVASIEGTLHAITVAVGRRKWVFHSAGGCHATPSIAGNNVLFGSDDGKVYAVDCGSGKLVWEVATGAEVWTSPVTRNGIVYFGSADANIYAVDALSGAPRWKPRWPAKSIPRPTLAKASFMWVVETGPCTVSMWPAAKSSGVPRPAKASIHRQLWQAPPWWSARRIFACMP